MTTQPAPDQFYTGLIAEAYAPLRGTVSPVEPYLRFVQRHGTPALELGCGHGEPLLDLVAEGLDVTGLDSSADMIALSRQNAIKRGLTVELTHASVEEMDLGRRFASIYFAGPTFQLIISLEHARRALERIREHLKPDGRSLVPLFIPPSIEPKHLGKWREHASDDGEILAFRAVAQDRRPDERRVDNVLQYRRGPVDDPSELVERTWSLRWYEDGEFEAMATTCGLRAETQTDLEGGVTSFVLAVQ